MDGIVLAAGRGVRMRSEIPKAFHPIAGKPMLAWTLEAVRRVCRRTVAVCHPADRPFLRAAFPDRINGAVAWQPRPLGTADAVKRGLARAASREILVAPADSPLLTPATLAGLIGLHRRQRNAATLLVSRRPDPFGYGRVICRNGSVRIVEEAEASPEERRVRTVNTGVYVFERAALTRALDRVTPSRRKGEYYLTDVVEILSRSGRRVGLAEASPEETLGVNSRVELAEAERAARRRILEKWMARGVTAVDPDHTYVDASVRIGRDTLLWPGTILRGKTRIGRRCRIGPNAFLEDTVVEDDAEIRASFLYGARVGRKAAVGPFSHIRGPARIGPGARIGNFTEVKKSSIGRNTKVSHLSYIGDARLGREINIGAGTITCNFALDGRKYRTTIGDRAFIGSNVNLVAPVRVGRRAAVAAGSTITRNVPPDSLAIARAVQMNKSGYMRKFRRSPRHAR